MKLSSAREIMREHLHPYFHHKKYVEKQPLVFERMTSFGSSVFITTVSGDDDMAYVKFFTGLRHNSVEINLVNTFGLADYFNTTSYTLLLNSKYLDNTKSSIWPCKKPADMTVVGDIALDFMDYKGFDFLNHYKHLSNLDRLFNDHPAKLAKWTNHNYLGVFRAMAIAKLSGRNDYDRLFRMHRSYLESRGLSGSITDKFDTTFAHLKKLSLN